MNKWMKRLLLGAVGIPAAGAAFYTASLVTKDLQTEALRNSPDPSKLILDKLAGQEQFKTDAGKEQLAAIRGDTQFTTALNNAIKNDPSVAKGIVDLTSSSGGDGMDGKTFAEKLANPKDRALFTKMLNKVAEKPDDKFDFKWMKEVGDSSAKKDYAKTKALLGEAGIQDKRLDLGIMLQGFRENPMSLLQMFTNPRQFFATLSSALSGFMGPAQLAATNDWFKAGTKVIEAYHPDRHTKEVMNRGVKHGRDLFGITDEENDRRTATLMGAQGNPTTTASLNDTFNNRAPQTAAATPPPGPRLDTLTPPTMTPVIG